MVTRQDMYVRVRYSMRHTSDLKEKKGKRWEGRKKGGLDDEEKKKSERKGLWPLYFNCRSIINTRMPDRFLMK